MHTCTIKTPSAQPQYATPVVLIKSYGDEFKDSVVNNENIAVHIYDANYDKNSCRTVVVIHRLVKSTPSNKTNWYAGHYVMKTDYE